MNKTRPRIGLLTCATLAGSLGMSATASALSMTDLVQGYALATQAAPKTADKAAEGKCGEGKCGAGTTTAAAGKGAEGKCGEGACGAEKGKTTPAPAPKAGDRKGAEGKCGEGKCGARH